MEKQINTDLIDIKNAKFINVVVQLNEYRQSLPKKNQPKFVLFLLQASRNARQKGDDEKATFLFNVYSALSNAYLADTGHPVKL